MYINELNLYNFRNFSEQKITFQTNINLIIGNNGVGKTTIIEAIYFLSNLKSPRTNKLSDLIKKNHDNFALLGDITYNNQIKQIKINYVNNQPKIMWHKKAVQKSEIIERINTIIFEPDDLKLIKGDPAERREYLDTQLAQLISKYYQLKKEYEKILKERNWLLKQIKYQTKVDYTLLDILTEKLIDKGCYIYNLRNFYITSINQAIGNIFFDVSGLAQLTIKYHNIPALDSYEKEAVRKKLKQEMQQVRSEEIEKGVTLIGPHRDDFLFYLNDNNLKNYGSQGQQRMSVIALKLAEIGLFQKIKNDNPILLLDDVFSELDVEKKNKLLKYISPDIQTFITTTDLNNFDSATAEQANKIILE